MCFDYERLPRGLLLDQLKHTEQRNVIAAEFVTVSRQAMVRSGITCVSCNGRLVRHRRYAIPTARIPDTYEQRKHPQPQDGGREQFAMAMKQTRHDFFDTTGSIYCQPASMI